MGSKYLKNALSVASLAYISWFLIIDNGEAIFQDINDLVYDQLPLYNNFKINEAKAYDTLQLIYKEKEEGLEGYLREVLQTKSRYIEVMCTCNKYRSKFCGNLNDLNTEDMLQMINFYQTSHFGPSYVSSILSRFLPLGFLSSTLFCSCQYVLLQPL